MEYIPNINRFSIYITKFFLSFNFKKKNNKNDKTNIICLHPH